MKSIKVSKETLFRFNLAKLLGGFKSSNEMIRFLLSIEYPNETITKITKPKDLNRRIN